LLGADVAAGVLLGAGVAAGVLLGAGGGGDITIVASLRSLEDAAAGGVVAACADFFEAPGAGARPF
jgi:hypothetical protein